MMLPTYIRAIFFFLWFGVSPLLLHEFGHWIMLKRYKIPFKFFFEWKTGCLCFEEHSNSVKSLKVGLAGAFPPLIILIPCVLSGYLILVSLGFLVCLFMALWSCVEVWKNISEVKR